MKVDNLFVVESPLQALVALELAESFRGEKNGIYYRLCGQGREHNDAQIKNVVDMGEWCFKHEVIFDQSGSFFHHQSVRKFALLESNKFNKIDKVFFGEFRSHWMHVFRMAMPANSYVLIDDGAATLSAKYDFIDKNIYFPSNYFHSSSNVIKRLAKKAYYNLHYGSTYAVGKRYLPVGVASAFMEEDVEYRVDFSYLRERLLKTYSEPSSSARKAYFFGSKYSEAGIVSFDSELDFVRHVVDYHKGLGLSTVYCSHRDESRQKLDCIRGFGCEDVILPDVPAELFLLERHEEIAMISAAYSSVINNMRLIFPDKIINSFVLKEGVINKKHIANIKRVYEHYEKIGINMVYL